ncbi:MAG TPA: RluA family pseudouridine synthase [Planctomycetota bacterium]|jgi:23S rRNA pseudouridine1911/1915/1917 synthase|nr:RluA family pseudouridine synthase [Planctomycetota bacterium]MDP7246424.1 RluA family pseudouridine synthase [Planctomycetota bacterium]HJM39069.1 RluA family pseudouridine synthase [Planctomycetota bacterium]|tara:strand:+ start:11627 stop:12721 length:1095 start_codon:yes stop_codon:yes gene_type:complete
MAKPRPPRKKRRGQRDLSLPFVEQVFDVGEPEHGSRLDSFLATRVSWRSREGVRKFIEQGWVEVLSGKDPQKAEIGSIRRGLKLRMGQEVVLRTPAPKPDANIPATNPGEDFLECVFEDDWLVAVNKPPNISVHPSKGHLTGSLIHLVHERHRRHFPNAEEVPTLCHRLDRETSGVMLCAKDQLSRTRIGRQFEARTVQKTYLALVVGEIPGDNGVMDQPLGKLNDSAVRLKMGVRMDGEGQASQTEWSVIQRYPASEEVGPRTLVELRPKTGRQHQLRVHLAAMGYPIVGDKLYLGGDDVFIRHVSEELTQEDYALLGMGRQALHAWKLDVEHPMTGKRVVFEAPLWPDMLHGKASFNDKESS